MNELLEQVDFGVLLRDSVLILCLAAQRYPIIPSSFAGG